MGKEDVWTIEGKLVRKPKSRDSYFRTRKEIAKKLATARIKGEEIFARIGNVKLEDEKFTIPVKINRGAVFTGEADTDEYSEFSEDWRREMAIDDLGIQLEEHFGIGPGADEGSNEAEQKKAREERQARLADMGKQGILPISHFTAFEEKDFES